MAPWLITTGLIFAAVGVLIWMDERF